MLLEEGSELPHIPALVGGHWGMRATAQVSELGVGPVTVSLTCLYNPHVHQPSHWLH